MISRSVQRQLPARRRLRNRRSYPVCGRRSHFEAAPTQLALTALGSVNRRGSDLARAQADHPGCDRGRKVTIVGRDQRARFDEAACDFGLCFGIEAIRRLV